MANPEHEYVFDIQYPSYYDDSKPTGSQLIGSCCNDLARLGGKIATMNYVRTDTLDES